MRQNKKALILAVISFLLLNKLCMKSAPLFLLHFCGKYCPGLPNDPEPHYFYYFCWKILPQTTLYLVETTPDPTIFIFPDKKFCFGLPQSWSGTRLWGRSESLDKQTTDNNVIVFISIFINSTGYIQTVLSLTQPRRSVPTGQAFYRA